MLPGVLARLLGANFGTRLLKTGAGIGSYMAGEFAVNSIFDWYANDADRKMDGFDKLVTQGRTFAVSRLLRRAFYIARWFYRRYPTTATDMILRLLRWIMHNEAKNVNSRDLREYTMACLVAHDCLFNTNSARTAPDISSTSAIVERWFGWTFGKDFFEPGMFLGLGEGEANILQYMNVTFQTLQNDGTEEYKLGTREQNCHLFYSRYAVAIEYVDNDTSGYTASDFNIEKFGTQFMETIGRLRGSALPQEPHPFFRSLPLRDAFSLICQEG